MENFKDTDVVETNEKTMSPEESFEQDDFLAKGELDLPDHDKLQEKFENDELVNNSDFKNENLKIKNQTEVDENGYVYTFDDKGRTIKIKCILKLSTDERKSLNVSMDKIGKGDQKATDQRGHLIADRFKGGNDIKNLVAMDGKLNNGDFKSYENKLANALADGKEVEVEFVVIYDGDSNRPSKFICTSYIDGEKSIQIFENGAKDI